jgi:hypothetical protein
MLGLRLADGLHVSRRSPLAPPTPTRFSRMADTIADTAARILELEKQQDDALRELEALERRIEQVLAEHLPLVGSRMPEPNVADAQIDRSFSADAKAA